MSDIILTAYNGKILGPIAKVLGWVMNIIYNLMAKIGIENIGLSIIIFTIIIYMLMYPITYKQQKFSKMQQKMQPELQKVQKKYQGRKDQESVMAMQNETQAIYEKYGVSPMGSCVYMLINMPILFALYRVFWNVPAYVSGVKGHFQELVDGIMATDGYQKIMTDFVEKMNLATTGANFNGSDNGVISNFLVDVLYKMDSSGWDALRNKFSGLTNIITDTESSLSSINYFFGLNISDMPSSIIKNSFESGSYLLIIIALLIPICSYLTQVLNIKLMPQAPTSGDNDAMARQMKMMNTIMPLFSLFFCFTVPVGLGIYWIASALVRSVQQFLLNKHFEKIDLDDIIKANQEKAKKKREKMGIAENQINNAARMNTKKIEEPRMSSTEKNEALDKAEASRSNAKPGSMASKANLVKEFNEKNNK